MKSRLLAGFLLCATTSAVWFAMPARSMTPGVTSGGALNRWGANAMPVQWSLNPKTGSNITGSRNAADVIAASFAAWTNAPNVALSATRGADTSVTSQANDGVNVICFTCSGNFNGQQDASTLAVTTTTVATSAGGSDGHGGTAFAGEILDADIFFNPKFTFSTDAGTDKVQDLQTVATHEIGHFFGLSHSAVVRAVMFPFSPDNQRLLSYDDVAGMSLLYPKGFADVPTGTISGNVTKGGTAVIGAHVFAESVTGANPFSNPAIRKSPIGALTRNDGTYVISGVPADSYTVTAEPLDLPVEQSDISDWADAFGSFQTSFTTRWF